MLFRRVALPALALVLSLSSTNQSAVAAPTVNDPAKDAVSLNTLGSDKYAKGDLKGAIADYDHALKLDPKLAKAYYNRGLAKYDQGSYAEAIADYDQAIKLNPAYEDAFVNRGLAKDSNDDLDGAIADDNAALKLDPKDPYAYNNRGWAMYRRGSSSILRRNSSRSAREASGPISIP